MSYEFNAIYEHGVLRPLTPLNLPELTEVTVFVHERVTSVPACTNDPLVGFMSDDPDLVDAIVAEAMVARENHPLRADG